MSKPSNLKTDRSLQATGQWLMYALFPLILCTISVVHAQTPNACEAELQAAEQQFVEGNFDSAFSSIRFCLTKKEVTTQDSVKAYILLGKIYLSQNRLDQAREAFKVALKLTACQLKLDANQETPDMIEFFKKVKKQSCGNKKWLLIGGGLAVAGGAAILILSQNGGNGQPPLADGFVQPPGRPPR